MLDMNKVKYWYEHKMWTKKMVADAVKKEKITAADYKEITGEDFE